MTAKKIFITGAAGKTGINTIKWLSESAQDLDIYAGIHREFQVRQEDLLKGYNVKTCVLEPRDPKVLAEQLRDVEQLFLIPCPTDDKFIIAKNIIDAAKIAGVRSVLLLSVLGADLKENKWGQTFKQMEDYLKASGLSWCILRANLYVQYLLLSKTEIKKGVLALPLGEGKFAPIDVADVGCAARQILRDCQGHCNKTYELSGPEALSGPQIASAFSKALKMPIQYRNVSPEEARSVWKVDHVADDEVRGFLDFYALAKVNTFDKATKTFTAITGIPPMALEQSLEKHKTELL